MIAKSFCYTLYGLEGIPIEVETDVTKGLPAYDMVGLPDTAVKESKERVRSAVKNSGLVFPVHKITVNFAPADLKKEGAAFDLAVAISLLKASEQLVSVEIDDIVFLGELALNGDLRPVGGLLPILISAKAHGFRKFVIPEKNSKEARYLEGAEVYPAETLRGVIDHLTGVKPIPCLQTAQFSAVTTRRREADLSFVKGQPVARRALEIAVSGGHNLLMVGPPGTGKTMLARCIPSIMPDLTFEEALEITKIHSVAGTLGEEGIITERPFRTPHHTATTVSMCGGGNRTVHPGEISLAHGGVLFLDELPEYNRSTLEALRQPLEDGVITIARATGVVTYPARFMLCASMNPCPCGNYGSSNLRCTCTPAQIRRYRTKISGPLLDRIDLQVEVDAVGYDDLSSRGDEESSEAVKARVDRARQIQRKRFEGTRLTVNAEMTEREIGDFCELSEKGDRILRTAFIKMKLSARARSRIIKVARTIADLGGSETIQPEHIFEAVSYRINDKME